MKKYDILNNSQTPTLTIFAGITGIDKTQFIKKFIEKANMKNQVLNLDFEKELLNEERNPPLQSPDIPSFLDSPNLKMKLNMVESNFKWLVDKINNRDNTVSDIFLSMHFSYYKNSEFFPPFTLIPFNQFFTKIPDLKIRIITLIDDVFSIWQQLKKKEIQFPNTSLRLRELLGWRSLEYLRAEALKEYLNSPEEGKQRTTNYLVSVRHPFSTFNNLIFKQPSNRIYLSYAISNTRLDASFISEINEFRKQIHTTLTDSAVFDPVAIDELALETALNEIPKESRNPTSEVVLEKRHRWPIDLPGVLVDEPEWPIKIPLRQIEEVYSDIRNQIASRDYILVDSSRVLAVYRPHLGGELSRGVDAEIKHAKEYGKKVVVYIPKNDQTTGKTTHPFGSRIVQFEDKKMFVEHLQSLTI